MKWEKIIKWPLLKADQISVVKSNDGLALTIAPGAIEDILDNACGAENWECTLNQSGIAILIRHPEGNWIAKAGSAITIAANRWGIGRELASISISDIKLELAKPKTYYSVKRISYKNRKITELCIVDADNCIVFDLNLHNLGNLEKKEITALMNYAISIHGEAAKVIMKTILSKLGKKQMSDVSKKDYAKFESMIRSIKPEDASSE